MADQFPSLHGDPEAEIAQRSPDGADGHHWLKDFVYRIRRGEVFDHDRLDHAANLAGTVQAAIQAGVHPKGEPEFLGSRPHPTAPDNYVLTYAVPVVPAVADTEPETTVTPTQVAPKTAAAATGTEPPTE